MAENPVILIVSGIDPTNGAGLGRDLTTVRENGGFPVSIPSTLTVQNSMAFSYSKPVDVNYVHDALISLQKEFTISAIKTGLLPADDIWISVFSELLKDFSVPVVIDPVLKATSERSGLPILTDGYLSLISGPNKIITPNLKELDIIYSKICDKKASQKIMARKIAEALLCTVVTTFEGTVPLINITSTGSSVDIPIELFKPERSVHGTGCTFSSAVATNLGKGLVLTESIEKAAAYTLQKIKGAFLFDPSGQYFLN